MSGYRRRHGNNPTEDVSNDRPERERGGGFMSWLRDIFDRDEDNDVAHDTPVLDSVDESTSVDESIFEDEAVEEEDLAVAVADVNLDGPAEEVAEEVEAKVEKRLMERSEDLEKVKLTTGSTYTVTDKDMAAPDPWQHVARSNGMSPENLQAFNQHILDVNLGAAGGLRTSPMVVGAAIYIPSAQELGFAEVRRKTANMDEAMDLWGKMSEGPNVKILDAARARASGDVGDGYGTTGVGGEGAFYTANSTLAGASKKRSKQIGGHTEYKVFWIPEFWKCSLYMHDVVWSAGYKPHQSDNNHYALAGRLNESKFFEEVSASNARPGDCWQRFGGRGSDESHNAILTTFVDVEDMGETRERWKFDILGAEKDRAAVSERNHVMKKGTSEIADGGYSGKLLRFFRPKFEQ